MGAEAATSAIVPATPEALLQLILSLEEPDDGAVLSSKTKKQKKIQTKSCLLIVVKPFRGEPLLLPLLSG